LLWLAHCSYFDKRDVRANTRGDARLSGTVTEQTDEPERIGLSEFRNQLRVQPNFSPGYPERSANEQQLNETFHSAVLQHPIKSHSSAIFDDTTNIVWIDSREEEDAIVHRIADRIGAIPLSAEVADAENDAGYEVRINYRDATKVITPDDGFGSRHATLNAIDELLSPEYQIRFVTDTNGTDTIGVVVELLCDWSRLYKLYGQRLNQHFCPIRELPDLMNTAGNVIDRACEDYAMRVG
jgi:hypothetical protein